MIETTLVLVKPDGIKRGLVGEIISRFERVGLKIVGGKMVWVDEEFAKRHYTEDISKRHGEIIRKNLLKFIIEGPVLAMVLEGSSAISNVRKIIGDTEPKKAAPGTIRGDFAHISYKYSDDKEITVKNLVHASANKEDAKHEINLWFKNEELHSYKTILEDHL